MSDDEGEMGDEPSTEPARQPSRFTAWWRGRLVGLQALLVLAAFAVALGVAGIFMGPSDTDTLADQRGLAFEACKRAVSGRLKAPATAKWRDPMGDQVTYSEQGADSLAVTVVRASVDSENGFGALVRSTYKCTVRDLGDQWEIVDLQVRQRD